MVVTEKKQAKRIMDIFAERQVSMAIFCTASHWNTEAILLAAKNYAKKHDIENLPLTVAMTFNYEYMPQAQRATYAGCAKEGLLSCLKHIDILSGDSSSTYSNVVVLPHLDHANPVKDMWGLTKGIQYLASVMFDAQTYPIEENLRMTQEYVKTFGSDVMIEGIIEQLTVEGMHEGNYTDDYVRRAVEFVSKTNIDFLVADLGTEQQSGSVGKCKYLTDRAKDLTKALDKPMLVLHGTSCLSDNQMGTLAQDGILRVNMWTRIAREAGQYAAEKLYGRYDKIKEGAFEACESHQYLNDVTEKAAEIMEHMLDVLGYAKLSGVRF